MVDHVQVGPKSFRLLNEARRVVGVRPGFHRRELPGGCPTKIGPVAMEILEATLSQGCIRQLLVRGGWKRGESLGPKGTVKSGRLWQRHETLPPLEFGPSSFELLRWMTSSGRTGHTETPLTIGDELLIYLACDTTDNVVGCPIARRSALAWLGFSESMSQGGSDVPDVDAFNILTQGAGAVIVEALTDDLADKWVRGEELKGGLKKISKVSAFGAAQAAVLASWLVAIEASGRRDLATFMVRAASRLLRTDSTPDKEAKRLRPKLGSSGSLRERQDAIRLSGAFLRSLEELGRWFEDQRYVRHFEDEYDSAQVILRLWKPLGRRGFAHADGVLRAIEAFDAMATGD